MRRALLMATAAAGIVFALTRLAPEEATEDVFEERMGDVVDEGRGVGDEGADRETRAGTGR